MRVMWFGVGVVAALMAALVLTAEYVARQPRTEQEAVAQVLEQRGVPYRAVEVRLVCTFDPRDCAWLGAGTFDVTVRGERTAHGRIVCRHMRPTEGRSSCTLSVSDLGLRDIPLPALVRDGPWSREMRRLVRAAEDAACALGDWC